jgi:general secretion pathway protein J
MKNGQSGFTLIEVIIAIMLMAVVSLIASRGLENVTRADSHLQANTEQTEVLLRALNQLRQDLGQQAGIELALPRSTGNSSPTPRTLSPLTVRSSDKKGFRLELIRRALKPGDGLQRVRWWFKGDTLYRAIAPPQDRYPLPAARDAVAVLKQVSDVQVRIWDADKGWRQLSGNRQENPLGLEIRLVRKTPQGVERYRQVLGPFN